MVASGVEGVEAGRPRVRDDLGVQLSPDEPGACVLYDRERDRYYRLEPRQALLLRLMDGSRSIPEIAASMAHGEKSPPVAAIAGFVGRAAGLGWLEPTASGAPGDAPAAGLAGDRARWRGILRIQLPFGRGEWLLSRCDPLVRRMYRPVPLTALTLGLLAAAGWAATRIPSLPFRPGGWPGLLLLLAAFCVVSVPHELGHALTLRYFGGRSGRFGCALLYGLPCFYADVSGAWLLRSRAARVAVGLAGLAWQLGFAVLLLVIVAIARPQGPAGAFLAACLHLSGLSALFNLNPLLRLDGYWVLCDLLDLPNLRTRSLRYLRSLVTRRSGGRPGPEGAASGRGAVYAAYGILAGGYTVALVAGLVLASIRWLGFSF